MDNVRNILLKILTKPGAAIYLQPGSDNDLEPPLALEIYLD